MTALLVTMALMPQSKDTQQSSLEQVRVEGYESRQVEGWTVLVSKELLQQEPDLAGQTLKQLQHQLYGIVRRVPPGAVEKLRGIRLWVEENEPHTSCAAYHPDPGWLREKGVIPEKAGCVEIANARNFVSWSLEQPWMVLHELAHAYHHRFLPGGFENAEIKDAYAHAMKEKLYACALRSNGKYEKAYAASNAKEYFAEASEAFFGTNDFYPFVRSELKHYDITIYYLIKMLWNVPSEP
jgi:hypothetical protein